MSNGMLRFRILISTALKLQKKKKRFAVWLRAKLNMFSSNFSMVTAVIAKTKEHCRMAFVFLLYILEKYYHNRSSNLLPCVILEPLKKCRFRLKISWLRIFAFTYCKELKVRRLRYIFMKHFIKLEHFL